MPEPFHSRRATAAQVQYLKALYRGAGLPFTMPCCSDHASQEIDQFIASGVKPISGKGFRSQQKRSHNHRARKARR